MRTPLGRKTFFLPTFMIALTCSIAAAQVRPPSGPALTRLSHSADTNVRESNALILSADETPEEHFGTFWETGTTVMAEAIIYLRDLAVENAKPMPAKIKRKLTPYFDPLILEKVRYTAEWSPTVEAALRRLIDTDKYALAVTLDNVIVFSDEESLNNMWLWVHELKHVEQYDRWGIKGFAYNYLLDYRSVEQAANDYARQVIRQMLTLTKK